MGDERFLLNEQLGLRLLEPRGLRFELRGLPLGLGQQFLSTEITLEDLEVHRDGRQGFADQRALLGAEAMEGGKFHHAHDDVVSDERPGDHVCGRGLAEAGSNLTVAVRNLGQTNRRRGVDALADQSFPGIGPFGVVRVIRQPVAGDAAHPVRRGIMKIQCGHAAAEQRHEVGQQVTAEVFERRGALQNGAQLRRL